MIVFVILSLLIIQATIVAEIYAAAQLHLFVQSSMIFYYLGLEYNSMTQNPTITNYPGSFHRLLFRPLLFIVIKTSVILVAYLSSCHLYDSSIGYIVPCYLDYPVFLHSLIIT